MKLKYRVQRHELQSDTEVRFFLSGIGHQSDMTVVRPIAEATQFPVGTIVVFSVEEQE